MGIEHSWDVDVEEAIRIQQSLRKKILLERAFGQVESVGGADVAYGDPNVAFACIAVFSFPDMALIEISKACTDVVFPYLPGLLGWREGPSIVEAFRGLKRRPDIMIFDGHGISHPRGFGLACHLGLWFDIPSIGCAKSPFFRTPIRVGIERGSYQTIFKDGKEIGAALRTRRAIKPVFVSPGHRIDLVSSIELVLASCTRYRIPEPLRCAHTICREMRKESGRCYELH